MFRQVIDVFQPGGVVLADRFYCRGRRLGREDHLVAWPRPRQIPAWMSRAEYDATPAKLVGRELRIQVRDKSKRVRGLVVATTLKAPETYPVHELRDLFRQRWHAELDLRALKTVMQMEMLRTRSPEMARKEIAAHLPAYNLIRGVMAEAARTGEG